MSEGRTGRHDTRQLPWLAGLLTYLFGHHGARLGIERELGSRPEPPSAGWMRLLSADAPVRVWFLTFNFWEVKMQVRLITALLAALPALGACYHATIQTGLAPSNQVLEQSFASSWIYGLVPPKTVETASRCPEGVAKVETKHSFLNQIVGFLTLGIYTPIHIRVTCAQAAGAVTGTILTIPAGAEGDEVRAAFRGAAELAAVEQSVVLVRFER